MTDDGHHKEGQTILHFARLAARAKPGWGWDPEAIVFAKEVVRLSAILESAERMLETWGPIIPPSIDCRVLRLLSRTIEPLSGTLRGARSHD